MTNKNINNLGAITVPLAGTEVIPIWGGTTTTKVAIVDLTAGRTVNVGSLVVGTGLPALALDVAVPNAQQRIYSTTVTNAAYTQYRNGAGFGYIGFDSSTGGAFGVAYAMVFWHSGNYPIIFGRNGAEIARFDTSNNLIVVNGNLTQGAAAKGVTTSGAFALNFGTGGSTSQMSLNTTGSLSIFQASTASAPTYIRGGMYFDTTLNKLRIGGATAWETVTSI